MKILVILASYNGSKYIAEQIKTILNQIGVDVELKIFDDLSTDNTKQIIEEFKSNKIELVTNSLPSGSAAANFFNAVKSFPDIFLQNYDFVAFSDQDDIWLENKLLNAVQMLLNDKSDLYCSNLVLWDEISNTKSIIKKDFTQKKYDFLFEGGSAGCTYVFTNGFCVNLSKSIKTLDYLNWKYFSHDWYVYFFARINEYKVTIDSNANILYRIHSDNVHGQLNKNSFFSIKERIKMIRDGWYIHQINGFLKILPDSLYTENNICSLYVKNYYSRCYVVFRYNFNLMRSNKKCLFFILLSLIPIKKLSKNV